MTIDYNEIEKKVMTEINSGRVKLRSKYIFLAEKLGVGSAFILTTILAVLFFTLVLYYLKASDNIGYLSFGSRGLFAFLESFPYLLVISLIVLILIAGFIIKTSDWSYKRPFGYLAISLLGFIIVFGSALAFTNIAERMENEAFGPHPMGKFLRPFMTCGFDERNSGIVGQVVSVISEEYILVVQTPRKLKKVDVSKLENPEVIGLLRPGIFIMAIGEKRGENFAATGLQILADDKIPPMIGRGIKRQFGPIELK